MTVENWAVKQVLLHAYFRKKKTKEELYRQKYREDKAKLGI